MTLSLASVACGSDRLSYGTAEGALESASCDFAVSDGASLAGRRVDLFRCLSAPSASGGQVDMLRVTYTATNGPNGASGLYRGIDEVYVRINGKDGVYPMTCRSDVSGSNGGTEACALTLHRTNVSTIDDAGLRVTDPGLFTFARRDAGMTVNAWDIELAFRSGSDWDSNGGANHRLRLEEKRL